ncbi:MAG: hypothetical protein ACXVBE_12760 [Bdellovibrionota bacterium]
MRSFLKSTLLFIGVCFITLGCAEVFVRYAVFSSADRTKGAEALWRSHRNLYNADNGRSNGRCSLSDSLMPNPFLGFTHSTELPCHPDFVTRAGLIDNQEFPVARDSEKFSVVLVGGSVASQMAAGPGGSPSWLEDSLNDNYISPNGKPFRVYSGALGAWHYPNQLTFLSLYGDSMDAVVALDGYNEAERAQSKLPIYSPDFLAYTASLRSLRFPVSTAAILLTGDFRRLALAHSLTAKSFLLYGLFQSFVNFALSHENAIGNEHYKSIGKFFTFPQSWTDEEKTEANHKKYYNYIRQLAGAAGALDLRYAHFVQPNRLIDKTLTEEEKQYVQFSSPEIYKRVMVASSDALAAKGLNTYSLTPIFKNESGTIYGDSIHCVFQRDHVNRGYELMADVMAEKIAKFWHLKKKPKRPEDEI